MAGCRKKMLSLETQVPPPRTHLQLQIKRARIEGDADAPVVEVAPVEVAPVEKPADAPVEVAPVEVAPVEKPADAPVEVAPVEVDEGGARGYAAPKKAAPKKAKKAAPKKAGKKAKNCKKK